MNRKGPLCAGHTWTPRPGPRQQECRPAPAQRWPGRAGLGGAQPRPGVPPHTSASPLSNLDVALRGAGQLTSTSLTSQVSLRAKQPGSESQHGVSLQVGTALFTLIFKGFANTCHVLAAWETSSGGDVVWLCDDGDCRLVRVPPAHPQLRVALGTSCTSSALCAQHEPQLTPFHFFSISLVWLLGKISKIPFSPNARPGLGAAAPAGVRGESPGRDLGRCGFLRGRGLLQSHGLPALSRFSPPVPQTARFSGSRPHSLFLWNFLEALGTQVLLSVALKSRGPSSGGGPFPGPL